MSCISISMEGTITNKAFGTTKTILNHRHLDRQWEEFQWVHHQAFRHQYLRGKLVRVG